MYVYENDIGNWSFRKSKKIMYTENINNWNFPNERGVYVPFFARLKPSYWTRYA
jgi:hypothetical protein